MLSLSYKQQKNYATLYEERQSMDQPSKVVNYVRGQLNKESEYFPVPVRAENLVSRDEFGSSVLRQPAHLHTQTKYGAYLRDSSQVRRRRPFLYLNRHTSGQSRVYRVTQLRTDGVHCRKSTGTMASEPQGSSKRVLPWQVTMVQPEYRDEQADAGRDCRTRLARPNLQVRTRTGKYSFSLFS